MWCGHIAPGSPTTRVTSLANNGSPGCCAVFIGNDHVRSQTHRHAPLQAPDPAAASLSNSAQGGPGSGQSQTPKTNPSKSIHRQEWVEWAESRRIQQGLSTRSMPSHPRFATYSEGRGSPSHKNLSTRRTAARCCQDPTPARHGKA